MGKGYTKQFKAQAMRLVTEQDYTPSRAARELGMPHSTLVLWLEKAGWVKPDPDGPPISDDPTVLQTQVRELRRQVRRLEMEKDILKKATAYFASQNLSASGSSTSDEGSSR